MLKRSLQNKRLVLVFVGFFLLISGVVCSLKIGSVNVNIHEIFILLFHPEDAATYHIVFNIRLPRILIGALVGMNLAVSGAILQGVLRNPIAEPSIIGISSGAGLFAIIVMILVPEQTIYVPLVSFIGAMLAATMVYGIAYRSKLSPMALILSGVAMASFLGAFMTTLMVFHSDKVQGVINWLAGGFPARSWMHLKTILPYSLFGLTMAFLLGRYVNILLLGDDISKSLGLRLELTRLTLIALSALLAASAVCVSGLIGFVGLIVPHMVRLVIGSNYSYLLPFSALFASSFVIWTDLAARTIFYPVELPVGIFMAFMGAPFFLFLLRKNLKVYRAS